MTIEYGKALQKGDAEAFREVAGMLAVLAPAYLGSYGIVIPDALVGQLIWGGLVGAMDLCRDDLMEAVQQTLTLVEANLDNLP